MQTAKIFGMLGLAVALGVFATIIYNVAPRIQPAMPVAISSFTECVAAGNAVMESYPRQCRTVDGKLFVEEIPNPPQGQNPNETPGNGGMTANGCAVAGCSGQLCVSAAEAGGIVSTCEFRAEYACYREASCEPQADGKCGWTQSPALKQCLANPPQEGTQRDIEVR